MDTHTNTSRIPREKTSTFDSSLTALTDAERRETARNERLRRIDRTQLARLEGSFEGTLNDLAEKRCRSVLGLASGTRAIGTVALVGRDVVVVDGPARSTIIGRRHVIWVQTQGETSQRETSPTTAQTTFADVVDQRFESGERLALAIAGQDPITGRFVAVGTDQITLLREGDGDTIAVPIAVVEQLGAL